MSDVRSDRVITVFVSYSARDASLARGLCLLGRAFGVSPWRDAEQIAPGAEWEHGLQEALGQCHRVIVLWCTHAERSSWVRQEVRASLRRGVPITPILLDGTRLPATLSGFQHIDLRSWFFGHRLGAAERAAWASTALLGVGALAMVALTATGVLPP